MQNDVLTRTVERSLTGRRAAYANEVARLLEAGSAVMQRTGVVDPAVRDIVREAGLSNQAFYRHFRSKDEFLLAILAQGRRLLLDHLEARMARAAGAEAGVGAWIGGVLAQARSARAAEATRPFAVNAGRLAHEFPDEVAASAEALKAPLVETLRDLGSPDPERAADAVYVLAMGSMERHLVAGTRPSDADVEHLVAFVLKAVA